VEDNNLGKLECKAYFTYYFLIDRGENIQTKNKVTIKMISKRSLIKGFMPNTLRDADKKYINSMKLKPWKDLIDNLFPIYIKTPKGIDQKTKKKNVMSLLKKENSFNIIKELHIKLIDVLILELVSI